ncbi:Uncharacterized protein YR821_1287 [Yersinia ruckeri]|uniref:Uncharacterized protein n=1 Tax=Yersinia ruckeri TaxID=29486 RepID=A0A0A8VBJ4_YERRU|nr:hypothetical protein yruck0001_20030 [Yersinia ruckeri ATCC 29473]QTD76215.1 Uncharacterized protein YR821_1287 [Yersinia ruckeri]CEK27117.1 hypothetical protein CSF007_6800 [Yersinia ruckeri]
MLFMVSDEATNTGRVRFSLPDIIYQHPTASPTHSSNK